MKSGKIFLKKLTGFIVASVFAAACLCMGFSAEAHYSPKYWYDKDGLFHEQHNSHAYDTDENGVRSGQVEVVTHSWYDREGNQHEITTTPKGTRENMIPAALSAKSRIRYFYDEKGIFHKEYTFFTPRGEKDTELVWYGKDGKQYGKEYGYVVINGQTLYRESVTTYDAKGWRHINIFWIYPDKSRRDKHIWFDDKDVRHEEWK
jgi:hypothetical protein